MAVTAQQALSSVLAAAYVMSKIYQIITTAQGVFLLSRVIDIGAGVTGGGHSLDANLLAFKEYKTASRSELAQGEY